MFGLVGLLAPGLAGLVVPGVPSLGVPGVEKLSRSGLAGEAALVLPGIPIPDWDRGWLFGLSVSSPLTTALR